MSSGFLVVHEDASSIIEVTLLFILSEILSFMMRLIYSQFNRKKIQTIMSFEENLVSPSNSSTMLCGSDDLGS